MRRLLIAATVSLLTAASASAAPLYHPMGPNLTFGDVAHGQSIMAGINNPAAGATAIRDDGDTVQFGIWNGFGVGYEVGAVDNLFDEIDAQISKIENTAITGDPTADITATVTSINDTLRRLADDGTAKFSFNAHLPVVPVIVSSDLLGGTLVFDGHLSAESNIRLLKEDIQFTNINDTTDDVDFVLGNTSFSITNESTYIVRAAATTELSLGYSREIFGTPVGKLYAGVRGKYLRVGLIRANVRLDDNTGSSEDIFDDIDNEDYTDSTAIGLDAGVILIASNYRVGATINNINEPSFEFNDFTDYGYDRDGQIYNALMEGNEYVMERQLKLEGALFTENQNWVITAGLDANAAPDAAGDEYQWATVSAAYINDGFILPGLRFGVRQNLSGTELSYLTAGLTLFGALNLDLAFTPEEVEVDEESVPQGLMFNLGLDVTF